MTQALHVRPNYGRMVGILLLVPAFMLAILGIASGAPALFVPGAVVWAPAVFLILRRSRVVARESQSDGTIDERPVRSTLFDRV